jgi:glycosyltransferase involved in cell wall biosynthesis
MSLKVTFAIPVYAPAWQYGGPVLSVSRLCEGLAAEGVDVRVLTTNAGLPDLPPEKLSRTLQRQGVEVRYFPVDQQKGAIRSRALEQALPEALDGVELLHISAIWQPLGLPLQRAALARGIPVLHSLRGALGPYSFQHGWWKKLPYFLLKERPLLQKAAGLHITSTQESRELGWLGLHAPRYLLPNPMDLQTLRPDPALGAACRARMGLEDNTPLLLICGRQHHKKGLDLLPPVLSTLREARWQLLVVGGDSDGSGLRLRRQLESAGLGGRLLWQPTVPAGALGGLYNAADLLLLPSRHENFGNVVVEALACGCAVAISDRTGVSGDLLATAPQGYGAVLPRRQKPWSLWLEGWLRQPRRAGAQVAAWAAEHYGQQAVARRAIEIYELILQTQPQRASPP